MQLLLKKVTILSPTSKHHLKKKDILIKNGIIEKIADAINEKVKDVIDEKNLYVSVGFMDLFADFCEPGFEHNETIATGMKAALVGGFTDICLIPNTNPIIQNRTTVESIKSKSTIVNLHPLGAISKNTEGNDLAEMYDMKQGGAIAFTDGKKTIQDAGLLLKALQYIKTFNGVILEIPENTSISNHGLMHEGIVSTQLGMPGKPAISEYIAIQQSLELVSYTNSKIHFTGVSTKKSIELIKQAKKQGLHVTCSVTPYHLLFTDADLETYDSLYKVNPPLRTDEDRKALLKAIEDGVVDCIASHHFPQDWDAKTKEFEYAKNGMITLQTLLPSLLKASSKINLEKWISLLTEKPREILSVNIPTIDEKQQACLTVFNPSEKWNYDAKNNESLSANSPLLNTEMIGKIKCVINNNQFSIIL
jgi:dihydroorotase